MLKVFQNYPFIRGTVFGYDHNSGYCHCKDYVLEKGVRVSLALCKILSSKMEYNSFVVIILDPFLAVSCSSSGYSTLSFPF